MPTVERLGGDQIYKGRQVDTIFGDGNADRVFDTFTIAFSLGIRNSNVLVVVILCFEHHILRTNQPVEHC